MLVVMITLQYVRSASLAQTLSPKPPRLSHHNLCVPYLDMVVRLDRLLASSLPEISGNVYLGLLSLKEHWDTIYIMSAPYPLTVKMSTIIARLFHLSSVVPPICSPLLYIRIP